MFLCYFCLLDLGLIGAYVLGEPSLSGSGSSFGFGLAIKFFGMGVGVRPRIKALIS